MRQTRQKNFLKQKNQTFPIKLLTRLILLIALAAGFSGSIFWEQKAAAQSETAPPVRIGEHLSYNFSFENFNNVAFAETEVVSAGKLGDRDAVELHSKFKTFTILSAAFYMIDQERTTYISPLTGLPIYIRKVSNTGVLPEETINNYLVNPNSYHDLLSLIYQIRRSSGIGSFTFQENERIYSINLLPTITERVKTEAGDFETTVVTAQSDFLTENGIQNFRINFSVDDQRLPVLIRFKTAKGEFRGALTSIQVNNQNVEPVPTPIPIPRPTPVPTPVPTPAPYLDNEPLLAELPFKLGETLDYQISANGQRVGVVTLAVKERKQFFNQDSLLLTATATAVEPNNQIFSPGDSFISYVNPATLAPQQIVIKTSKNLAAFNQTAIFDQKNGTVTGNAAQLTPIPVGTHSLLSLAYAIRSFNLKPSKDPNNPVNDTRVAVLIGDKPYVLTLRPSTGEIINLRGEKVAAQMISISTGNPQFDVLSPRLWLNTDENRLPLRFTIGSYQADLIEQDKIKTAGQ